MSYTSATEPHPRAALRNKNLPTLPPFEFPAREPSPQPSSSQPHMPYDSPQQHRIPPSPPRSQSHPSSLEPQIQAQLDREIEEAKRQQYAQSTLSKQFSQAKVAEANQYPHTTKVERSIGTEATDKQTEGHIEGEDKMAISDMSKKGQWIFYAITSGGCAAVNGVFAKLTTTEVTTNFATFLANIIGLEKGEKVFEFVIRAIFFALNLLFNGIMWALFTKALSRSPSTTQVCILNTSSNFMLTALLGFIIFSESLPPMWWLGASLLVAGNVIIGRREEKDVVVEDVGAAENRRSESGDAGYRDSREEGHALLADDIELSETESEELKRKRIAREVEDDILDLEPPANGSSRM